MWEHARPEYSIPVHLYGKVMCDAEGFNYTWYDTKIVYAVAYDMPVPGYGKNSVCNTMRFWSAKSSKGFDLDYCKWQNFILISRVLCMFFVYTFLGISLIPTE